MREEYRMVINLCSNNKEFTWVPDATSPEKKESFYIKDAKLVRGKPGELNVVEAFSASLFGDQGDHVTALEMGGHTQQLNMKYNYFHRTPITIILTEGSGKVVLSALHVVEIDENFKDPTVLLINETNKGKSEAKAKGWKGNEDANFREEDDGALVRPDSTTSD